MASTLNDAQVPAFMECGHTRVPLHTKANTHVSNSQALQLERHDVDRGNMTHAIGTQFCNHFRTLTELAQHSPSLP